MDDKQPWPKETPGIYVVSRLPWSARPSDQAQVLYVGGNPKNPIQLLNRIGLLIKDMLGFWGDFTGSHIGGEKLWCYCHQNKVHPLDLYLSWAPDIACSRCAENDHYDILKPLLNKNRPASCKVHIGARV